MRTFLHIGCGPKRKDQTTRGFNIPEWRELRLDIDPDVKPDIVGSMMDMSSVEDGGVDAVFSSHNIGADVGFDPEYPASLDDQFRVRTKNSINLLSMDTVDWGISPTQWQRAQYPIRKCFLSLSFVI